MLSPDWLEETFILRVLHVIAAAAVTINVYMQQSTGRADEVGLRYHVFGSYPYFMSLEREKGVDGNETGPATFTMKEADEPNGTKMDLKMLLLLAEIIAMAYHLASAGRMMWLRKIDSEQAEAWRESVRLHSRMYRAVYNSIALGLVQITLMLVLGVQNKWLYVFVFGTHVAYHFSVHSVEGIRGRPKSWLGGSLVVLLLYLVNTTFFWEVSRVETHTLYRPPVGDELMLPTCVCQDIGYDTDTGVADSFILLQCDPADRRHKHKTRHPLAPFKKDDDGEDIISQDSLDCKSDGDKDVCAPCFDIYGDLVPSDTNIDLLVVAHILINGLYALHLLLTKWPQALIEGLPKGMKAAQMSFDAREMWGVSTDLGYVVLDIMYMGAVPAGIYALHREVSRSIAPHAAKEDKDDYDWNRFQEIYFYVAVVGGIAMLIALSYKFRAKVQLRIIQMDNIEPGSVEKTSLVNAKVVHGMSKGEMVPMLGTGYA